MFPKLPANLERELCIFSLFLSQVWKKRFGICLKRTRPWKNNLELVPLMRLQILKCNISWFHTNVSLAVSGLTPVLSLKMVILICIFVNLTRKLVGILYLRGHGSTVRDWRSFTSICILLQRKCSFFPQYCFIELIYIYIYIIDHVNTFNDTRYILTLWVINNWRNLAINLQKFNNRILMDFLFVYYFMAKNVSFETYRVIWYFVFDISSIVS